MHHLRRAAPLFLALGTIALLGIGCKSPQEKLEQRIRAAQEQASQIATQTESAPVEETAEPRRDGLQGPDPSPEIIYLQQVMRNLGRAETFRAIVDVPVQEGEAEISVDYNKAIGLYGRLRIEDEKELTISDVFISENEIHFRANTTTWTNITETEQADVLRALFQRATLPSAGGDYFVSGYAQIQAQTETGDCTLYAFKQYNQLNARVELYQICVQGDLPTYVITESPFGEQRIDYKDINSFVDVQHP